MTARKLFARTWLLSMFALLVAASCGGGDSTGPAAVTALRFSAQPTSVAAGATFSVTVELVSATGARATGANDPVTITALGGGTVSGPASVAAASGVATFDGLMLTHAGTNVQLVATSGAISAASTAFAVAPGPANLAHSVIDPAPCTTTPNGAFAVTFTFTDAFGNKLPSASVTLTSSLAGSTLTPSTGVTTDTGTFATTFNSTTAGSAAITATVAGTQLAFTPSFVIASLGAPAALTFPGSVTGTIPSTICTNGLPSSVYAFTMATAGGASFTVNSVFQPAYIVQANATAEAIALTASQMPAVAEWLLPAGSYQYGLGTLSGSGTFSITAASVPANTGCFFDTNIFRSIVVSGTYSGQTLGAGDCAFGDGSFFDTFALFSSLPCTLTLSSAAFNPGIYIYDAVTGDLITGVDNVGAGNDAAISLTNCRNGGDPLFIITNSFAGGETGAYTLTVALQGGGAMRAGGSIMAPRLPQHSISPIDISRLMRVKLKAPIKKSS